MSEIGKGKREKIFGGTPVEKHWCSHRFRPTKQDDFFPLTFDHFKTEYHFKGSWGNIGYWHEPKTKPLFNQVKLVQISTLILTTVIQN